MANQRIVFIPCKSYWSLLLIRRKVVPEALRIGESVGRLVLLWQAPPSTGVLPQVRYSGVWLDDRFFLTCAHGLPRSSSRALCKETVRQLSVDENPWAYVFSENVFEHFVNDRGQSFSYLVACFPSVD